jgi:hypothetical protein
MNIPKLPSSPIDSIAQEGRDGFTGKRSVAFAPTNKPKTHRPKRLMNMLLFWFIVLLL